MAIALTDLLDEKQVILRVALQESAKRAARDYRVAGAKTERSMTRKRSLKRCSRANRRTPVWSKTAPHSLMRGRIWLMKLVVGIGRSRAGIPFGHNGARARLIFVIGVPERLVNDYLICVGTLVRLVKR